MEGWIKLYRVLKEWEWYKDSHMVHLFIHLLLSANRQDGKWRGIEVKRGQLITGRIELSNETGISQRSIRTCIERLKSTNELTIKTTNKYSIITICKYEDYQSEKQTDDQQYDNPLTNNRPTIDQQSTTNKKEEKEKKKRIDICDPPTLQEVVQFFKEKGFDEHLAARAWSSYDANNWLDSKNQKIVNWKMKMIQVWFREENRIKPIVNPHAAATR